ncbi:MAG: GyrI-like domain-containing protein [Planctomycetes bacterium]|nr:GyrI-like domain-containing protein [Planctomycetota bacterium]
MRSRPFLLVPVLVLGACIVPPSAARRDASQADASPDTAAVLQTWTTVTPDLPVSQPPFRQVHANWKQRLDQPYVYVPYTGSYVQTGRLLPMVQQAMLEQGLQPSGPPFALYYDDPGRVPADQLRSRACVPIDAPTTPGAGLSYDVLPSTTVVYAFVGGAYPEVGRAYPGLYGYMRSMGWSEAGPVREAYLVAPDTVQSFDELVTEVQIPVTFAP